MFRIWIAIVITSTFGVSSSAKSSDFEDDPCWSVLLKEAPDLYVSDPQIGMRPIDGEEYEARFIDRRSGMIAARIEYEIERDASERVLLVRNVEVGDRGRGLQHLLFEYVYQRATERGKIDRMRVTELSHVNAIVFYSSLMKLIGKKHRIQNGPRVLKSADEWKNFFDKYGLGLLQSDPEAKILIGRALRDTPAYKSRDRLGFGEFCDEIPMVTVSGVPEFELCQ